MTRIGAFAIGLLLSLSGYAQLPSPVYQCGSGLNVGDSQPLSMQSIGCDPQCTINGERAEIDLFYT